LRVAAGDSIETSVTMAANMLALQRVVIAGADIPTAGSAPPFAARAPEPALANQCFSITLAELVTPATMPQSAIILLGPEQRQVTGDALAGVGVVRGAGGGGAGGRGGGGGRGARGSAGARSPAGSILPTRVPLGWERTGADSILVRWPTEGQEIVLRLRLTNTGVVGTAIASNEVDPPRFASVTGTTVSCARE
jgi:hypothetical protein